MADPDIGAKRMTAFLALIRSVENKGVSGPQIYHKSYGGHSFMKMSDHPRKEYRAWGHKSDAAGAYQIRAATFDDAKRHGIVHDFSPQSQDRVAVWLIQRAGASTYITAGDFHSAYMLLHGTWSALPGGRAPEISEKDEDQFIEDQLDPSN